MTKKLEIAQMEQRLTHLLGKQSYITAKKACTGKYHGFYDYGLTFQDGSHIWISLGREYYAKRLREKVDAYQFFRSRHVWLEEQIRNVIYRDNLQADALGLSPIEFVRLELVEDKNSSCEFWVRAILKHNGRQFHMQETMLNYACLGHQTEEYFAKKQTRPDESLGFLHEWGQKDFAAIIFGYLYEREGLHERWAY